MLFNRQMLAYNPMMRGSNLMMQKIIAGLRFAASIIYVYMRSRE